MAVRESGVELKFDRQTGKMTRNARMYLIVYNQIKGLERTLTTMKLRLEGMVNGMSANDKWQVSRTIENYEGHRKDWPRYNAKFRAKGAATKW